MPWSEGCARALCVLLLLLLTACAAPPANMPVFVVKITPAIPGLDGGCTGTVIGARAVLTARHCVQHAYRVVTVYGQEVGVEGARVSREHDVAILITRHVMWVGDFAELGNPALGTRATIWGHCPYQQAHVPRYAVYNGLVDATIRGNPPLTYGEWILPKVPGVNNQICPGDSGAAFVDEQGRVVGIVSGGNVAVFFIALASIGYSVPVPEIRTLLDAP